MKMKADQDDKKWMAECDARSLAARLLQKRQAKNTNSQANIRCGKKKYYYQYVDNRKKIC